MGKSTTRRGRRDGGPPDALREWVRNHNAAVEHNLARLSFRAETQKLAPIESILEDLGFGYPPHAGVTPLRRLLAKSLRAALGWVSPKSPAPLERLACCGDTSELAFAALDLARDDRERAAAVLALAALTMEERAPTVGTWTATPREKLERALREGHVPSAVATLTRDVLADPPDDFVRVASRLLDDAHAETPGLWQGARGSRGGRRSGPAPRRDGHFGSVVRCLATVPRAWITVAAIAAHLELEQRRVRDAISRIKVNLPRHLDDDEDPDSRYGGKRYRWECSGCAECRVFTA
jgi:hypothetical protein